LGILSVLPYLGSETTECGINYTYVSDMNDTKMTPFSRGRDWRMEDKKRAW